MPFIGGILGAISAAQQQGTQQKGQQLQNQIASQEMADKQKAFQQLMDFFGPYLQSGSPFLQMIQRAAAEQNATGANNAAGMVRNSVERSGLGYGPSGTEAAALGGLGAETARTGASNYLENLLNNENLKFQAAQGIQGAGGMAGAGQNQPNVSTQLPAYSLPSSIGALGNILGSSMAPFGGGPGGTSQPNSAQNFLTPGTTQGWAV